MYGGGQNGVDGPARTMPPAVAFRHKEDRERDEGKTATDVATEGRAVVYAEPGCFYLLSLSFGCAAELPRRMAVLDFESAWSRGCQMLVPRNANHSPRPSKRDAKKGDSRRGQEG